MVTMKARQYSSSWSRRVKIAESLYCFPYCEARSHLYYGRVIKRLKSKKKEGRLISTTIAGNIYCKSCAALYKENSRLYVYFQSRTESKMVIFAQMKLMTFMKLS